MEKIKVFKDGIIKKKKRVFDAQLMALLGNSVSLENGFSLASFFAMIRKYPRAKEISPLLDTYLEMVPDLDHTLTRTDEIDGLVFFKTIEVIGFPGKPAIHIFNSLKGRQTDGLQDLKFFHLESLLGHTMELGQLRHIIFGDKQDVFMFDTFYTLFELIEGIAWELSFNFNPLECSIRR